MPQQTQPSVLNNFNQGYRTEYTGLNFPENASTDTQNCVFNRIGNVTRRPGINYETNFTQQTINRTNLAINTYRWKNVGGDGLTQVVVTQIGSTLRFYRSSSATIAAPLSTTILVSTVTISSFLVTGGTFDATAECQFADGNGYLFVFHPSCDPFYCTYNAGTITPAQIKVQIRDFAGVPESPLLANNARPSTLSTTHSYNLINQGWGQSSSRFAWSSNIVGTPIRTVTLGTQSITISTGMNIVPGDTATIVGSGATSSDFWSGTVTVYTTGTGALTINITSVSGTDASAAMGSISSNTLVSSNKAIAWNTAFSGASWPSNADVWWLFKNASNPPLFDPANTINSVTLSNAPAARGNQILEAFKQQRTATSGVAGITDITTTVRPRTGTFFQGRVWYTGVDASFQATGTAPYTTWTENIYFSQIVDKAEQFGYCYSQNDPTDENFFDLLPDDGGVIVIQGSGSIYKLFPIHNGLIVFAANGVWYITGSTGIGFTANDYTISKISSIQSISSTSFVDVRGTPYWWNEEGIYRIESGKSDEGLDYGPSRGAQFNSGLKVEPISFTTIDTFYHTIPLSSKKFVRGTYDALNWEVRWIYLSTEAATTTGRYQFDRILTLNTISGAFSPWTLSTTGGTTPFIHGVEYVQGPGGSTAPTPVVKYYCSISPGASGKFTFAEENDTTTFTDWTLASTSTAFTSYFITGYRLKGAAQHRFQTEYLFMYSNNSVNTSYKFQPIWLFAINQNSNKFGVLETVTITDSTTNFGNVIRRHRLRGRGLVNQFKVTSVTGQPFNILGWAVDDKVNAGV